MIKKFLYAFMSLFVLSLIVATPALADNNQNNVSATVGVGIQVDGRGEDGGGLGSLGMMHGRPAMMKPTVFGTVTAVSGNTITISGKQGLVDKTNVANTVFTIDATNAKIMKSSVTGSATISNIVVGDTIVVQGTVTGTNVVATIIRDGMMPMRGGTSPRAPEANPAFTGNGQPVVAGTVTVVSGNTITITNKSNVTYTVDATSAKVLQGANTITVSNVAVGDNLVVQGAVNGNAIVATTVIDQHAAAATNPNNTDKPEKKGFFAGIGAFFSHLFGF